MNIKQEDKRIGKSKSKMKNALIDLLSQRSVDDISVIQICLKANVTRITFYTYYTDKNALLEEMFRDMASVANDRFLELQEQNNAKLDPAQSYCNLLTSILDLFYARNSLLPFALQKENPNLYLAFSRFLTESVSSLKIGKNIRFRFSSRMMGDFLCNGLWGFVCQGRKEHRPVEKIREEANDLIRAVVKAGIVR